MVKRKKSEDLGEDKNDDIVPIPIQFFFWNQTSLFIKQKFSNLTEAHALNFERVIVQNILHGLSPGLSDAINSISRWAFIKASFPHIMHACASTLQYRRDNNPTAKLNKTETKLLYTLHWLILDAASECEDNAVQKNKTKNQNKITYLHSVATIQLFVYLFIPILKSLTPSDLDNLKLSNGLQIWQALWSCRQPNVKIFNTPVKLKHDYLIKKDPFIDNSNRISINKKETNEIGAIYMGVDETQTFVEKPKLDIKKSNIYRSDSSIKNSCIENLNKQQQQSDNEKSKYLNISYRIEESDSNLMSQMSDFEGDTIRDSLVVINEMKKPKYSLTSVSKAPLAHMSSICSISDSSTTTLINQNGRNSTICCSKCSFTANNIQLNSDGISCPNCTGVKLRENVNDSKQDEKLKLNDKDIRFKNSKEIILTSRENLKILSSNVKDATYFDIAVMRCLLSSKWHPDGFLWCLDYLSCRVVEITDYTIKEQDDFYKINSLSIPTNLNDLCVLMGVNAIDLKEENDVDFNRNDFFKINKCGTNEFIHVMNQIYLENDFMSKNHFNFDSMNYFAKRKKYESSFQTRISGDFNGKRIYFKNGRIKYIDDEYFSKRKRSSCSKVIEKTIRSQFATTPFTKSELEELNKNTDILKKILKKDCDTSSLNNNKKKSSKQFNDWSKDFEQKFNYLKQKVNCLQQANNFRQDLKTPKTNLNRFMSFSDSYINYQSCYDQVEEATGSSGLINTDGSLNLNMILKGAHSVLLKENCLKLCDLSLNILENLISIDILPSIDIDEKIEYAKNNLSLSQASYGYLEDLESKYNDCYYIAADLALRNIKWLGCVNCQSNLKSFLNDQLRGRVKLILGRLFKKNRKRFQNFFKNFIEKSEINHLMETFHALFGYCHDPLSGYGHYYPHVTVRNSGEKLIPTNMAYDMSPPTGPDGTAFNIEGVMIEIIIKPLVDRLIEMKSQLVNQENLYLYSDIRSFLSYMKENHGNIFRKIALSNMLDSYIKINQETQIKNLKLIEIDDKLKELDKLKQIISNHVAIKPEMAHLIEEENPHRIMKSNLENDSKRSSFRHRTTKIGSKNNLDSDQNDSTQILNDNLIPLENLSSRRGSEASFRRMKKLKEHKKPSFSIADDQEMTGSKLDEDSVKVKKDLNVLFTTDIEILNNLYEQTLAYRRKIQSEKIFINSRIVFKGLEYYRFLMECLPPASLPDVPFMSALLELEAPVLSKASFLIETAYFVNRCNKKDWPEWIKMNISMCRPYGSFFNNKNLPNTLKRNKVFQLAAANIFSAWGEVLAIKLEAILNERKNNLCENDMKPEDFFDDKLVNPDGNNCPFGLINIVCLLLLEITKFLRETYQYMPKKINNIYSLRQDNIYSSNNLANNSSIRFNQKENRMNRANIGSVFSNESSRDLSIAKENKLEMSHRVPSNDNISITVCNENDQNSEVSRHISFNLFKDNHENKSLSSSVNRIGSGIIHDQIENEGNRLSAGAVIKSGNALSQENIKSASNSHINQKRNSIKRRPSLKYRDRGHRMNASSSFINRKLSHANSQSDEKQELEHSIHVNPSPGLDDTILIIAEEASQPSHSGAVTFSGVQTPQNQAENNFECEVDEVDFNRCFPWIKIVIKIFNMIDFDCAHSQVNNAQNVQISQIQIKNKQRQHLESCCKNCYLKLFRNSHSLIEAVLRMYETSTNINMFEKYKKQMESKLKDNNNHSTMNKGSQKLRETTHSAKTRKNSQCSSNSQKIFFINNILKKNTINKASINSQLLVNQSSVHSNHVNNNNNTTNQNALNYETLKSKLDRNKEKIQTTDYIYNQVHFLNHIPLQLLCKSALVMNDELFIDVLKFSWNLLLNSDQEICSSAATLFLIGSIKQPTFVEELIRNDLRSKDVEIRYNTVLKFESLWKFRYHVWPRLEANANNWLKISPPCIEFVLPSPPIGAASTQPVDPPWMPKAKTKVEEVTINQEEVRAVVTASKSRKKHQQEILHKALEADKMNKKIARELFNFSELNYLHHASFEPFLYQSKEETEEGLEENPEASSSTLTNEIQQSQPVFPTSIASGVLCLIDLLFDHDLNSSNQSIASVTHRIVWTCLTEDATLFLRYFFEKITQKDKKNLLIQYLKRLLSVYIDLPPQTAYVIFNYLLGVVMYFVRTSSDSSQEAIASIQTIIWRIAANVNGIVFKDLKQTLRKEQCDPSLLITANVPSAKKLIVHGPDLSQIPNQFPIYDNTQFAFIIQESFGFFKIPESKKDRYFLFDIKTNQIHIPDTYVRNFYFFRRNFYPQLSLVEMDPKEANKILEKAAFNLKILEQSKVLFFRKLLDNTPFNQVNSTAAFLHEELIKLPMFPRKALEADFNLYPKLPDRELLTTDMLHKYSWCQLIWSLFSSIDKKTASTWDITLFLSVVNGSFMLHCEDLIMIRTCLAIYLNSAQHFQHIFATNGFLLIMPTLMKVYSNMQANPVLKNAIEFCCLQFYVMHRIPFILQLFGSIAQILDLDAEKGDIIDTTKVQASALFSVLLSLETNIPDNLKILELVKTEKDSNSPSQSSSNTNNLTSQPSSSNIQNLEVNVKPHENQEKVIPPNQPQFSSPANLLTNAGSSAAVLAVSGISATNLLISSSGALGISQIASLNKELNQPNQPLAENILTENIGPPHINQIIKNNEAMRNNQTIKTLDFCYQDDQNIKFNMIDSINLCVTVIAYATHAPRANQMLTILNVIVPRYFNHLKAETEKISQSNKAQNFGFMSQSDKLLTSELALKARNEFIQLQKMSISLKTLVNSSDYLTRVYQGPRNEGLNANKPTQSNVKNSHNRSPSIIPDEDSMIKGDDKRKDQIDDRQIKQEFTSPRDTLLNVVSEFVFCASKRIKELYKMINDSSLKVTELLDTKAHSKLVEISHTLLKLWDDSATLGGSGLQNYFQKLLPVTNWSQEELKPAFNNLLRRVDRLFTKISKRPSAKRQVDWTAIASIINGLYITLDRQENIANLPYFKMLINSTISLILNETTSIDGLNTGSIFSATGSAVRVDFQLPVVFSKSVIRLVGKYITLLKDQSNLEQLFGGTGAISPISPTVPTGLTYLLNFLLPLLIWSASDRKDSPKLNSTDMSFIVNMVLNALKPPSKLAATLLLQAPKQHHLTTAFDSNPQGNNNKSTKQMKDLITQSTFLTLKLLTFSFAKQIDLIKIASTIRQICFKAKNIYLWKFLDFISSNRTPLFLLLKPFIENFVATQTCETELESHLRHTIQLKLNCLLPTNEKCTNLVIDELIEELNIIKADFNGESKQESHDSRIEENENKLTCPKDEKSSSSTPNRNIAFKYNKTKKDISASGSLNTTPRKKFEKLNYKNGAEILDVYRAKLRAKLIAKESEREMENLTNINLLIPNSSSNKLKSDIDLKPIGENKSFSQSFRKDSSGFAAGLNRNNEEILSTNKVEIVENKENEHIKVIQENNQQEIQTSCEPKKHKLKKILFV